MGRPSPPYLVYSEDFENEEGRKWSLEQIGLYGICMKHAIENDGLPQNSQDIARALGVRTQVFQRLWPGISDVFPLSADGRRRNPRAVPDLEAAKARRERARNAASVRYNKIPVEASGASIGGAANPGAGVVPNRPNPAS